MRRDRTDGPTGRRAGWRFREKRRNSGVELSGIGWVEAPRDGGRADGWGDVETLPREGHPRPAVAGPPLEHLRKVVHALEVLETIGGLPRQ